MQRFRYVTLPQLKSVLFVIVLLRSIWMFTKFDTPWLMIQGGGAETYIRTLPIYTYLRTFAYYEAGLGSAMAVDHVPDACCGDRSLFPPLEEGRDAVNRSYRFFSPGGQLVASARSRSSFFSAFPFFWMGSTALKDSREIFVTPPSLWPNSFTLEHVERLFSETKFLTYFRNSLVVSFSAVGVTLLLATPAAYSLTRFRFCGREQAAATVLFSYMFAPIMIIIPFYVMMRFLGPYQHACRAGDGVHRILPPVQPVDAAVLLPEHPVGDRGGRADRRREPIPGGDLCRRAARIPGLDRHRDPTFILAWNDYIFARILLSRDELKTLPVGIADLYNASVVDWGMIMAAGLLVITPVLGCSCSFRSTWLPDGARGSEGLAWSHHRRPGREGLKSPLGSSSRNTWRHHVSVRPIACGVARGGEIVPFKRRAGPSCV